jgi:microcystin-dependent protein
MSQPYIGEIRMFGGNFAPAGWAFCDGSILSIAENEVLFQLIGTTYGGDGQSTFALPDLRGRLPVHQGTSPFGTYTLAQMGGVESVTLNTNQIPSHNHSAGCNSNPGNAANPAGAVPAQNTTALAYVATIPPQANMNAASIGNTGGNQPHANLQPYLCVSFIISLFGIFPTPT